MWVYSGLKKSRKKNEGKKGAGMKSLITNGAREKKVKKSGGPNRERRRSGMGRSERLMSPGLTKNGI